MMKAIYKKRLLKLAEHLEKGKLGHETFNFGTYNSEKNEKGEWRLARGYCGTFGCALGECPVIFPKQWMFSEGSVFPKLRLKSRKLPKLGEWKDKLNQLRHPSGLQAAELFFDLEGSEADHLFIPCGQAPSHYGGRILRREATREEVAKNIREFIKRKEQAI